MTSGQPKAVPRSAISSGSSAAAERTSTHGEKCMCESELRRLRQVKEKSDRLKRLVADVSVISCSADIHVIWIEKSSAFPRYGFVNSRAQRNRLHKHSNVQKRP